MPKFKVSLIIFLFIVAVDSFLAYSQQKINWNGYLQYRFTDNYINQTEFSVRRAKLWVDGDLPFNTGNWKFKLQSIFFNKEEYFLRLQDIYVEYNSGEFDFTAGQFVPDFSLQRKQPDYLIPFTERANVINALVPAAETMGRDIGIELKYKNSIGGINLGFFNGNGANNLSNRKNFLYVNRTYLRLKNKTALYELGYSLSYRNANQLKFTSTLGDSAYYSGKDFRYGFDAGIKMSDFEFQTEYLEVRFANQKARGFYVLSSYNISSVNLFAISVEQLYNLSPSFNSNPIFKIGYSRLIKSNYIKLSIDNSFQKSKSKINSSTIIQIQYFFNQ